MCRHCAGRSFAWFLLSAQGNQEGARGKSPSGVSISMSSRVFKPYAGVSTAVPVFTNSGYGGTHDTWFYDMKADGFSLNNKQSEVKENDIPDIVQRFHNRAAEKERARAEQSFRVPKAEIAENACDLSINKY